MEGIVKGSVRCPVGGWVRDLVQGCITVKVSGWVGGWVRCHVRDLMKASARSWVRGWRDIPEPLCEILCGKMDERSHGRSY